MSENHSKTSGNNEKEQSEAIFRNEVFGGTLKLLGKEMTEK